MPAHDARAAQAGAFGAAAAEYDRGRPSYPPEAVGWLLPVGVRRVLDLGAGTGQLARRLVERGLDVVAVEPSPQMRHQLAKGLPEVCVLAGSAERIPLDDSAVDAVLVAQAWHWVNPDQAVPEIARVLRPGGRLGLVWNIRDERLDWVAQLGQLMRDSIDVIEYDMRSDNPSVGAPFAPVERFDIEWTAHVTTQSLLDLVASRSSVITLPPQKRHALFAEVRNLITSHPTLASAREIILPYVTRCSRTTKD
jgi:SAM-dependent methyltransferase